MRLAAFLLVCGCAAQDVVVAEIEAGPDGHGFRTCVGNQDCAPNELCSRHDCGDVTGGCAPRPPFCDADRQPTCGCDGITYWNDCLRRGASVTASTPGTCDTNAVTCDATTPCPTGTFCARLAMTGACDPSSAGACWGLPDTCPADASATYERCPNPKCSDACNAIRDQQAYAQAPTCH